MGLTYDNGHTRTVEEVWRDGKANCLSMTAFYVAACRALEIQCTYAEALNTNHWRKVGNVIRYERHVVALASGPPSNDLIADFVPDLRKRFGTYVVAVVPENRFRALFFSIRAVEALSEGDLTGAKDQAQQSLDADPKSSVGWNVLGVVEVAMGEKDPAEVAYRKAMALDPCDGAPLGNMETLLREAGRMVEALSERDLTGAKDQAQRLSLAAKPKSRVGCNVLGVGALTQCNLGIQLVNGH
jgi:tetratricopeptide (TPR) repeat protein